MKKETNKKTEDKDRKNLENSKQLLHLWAGYLATDTVISTDSNGEISSIFEVRLEDGTTPQDWIKHNITPTLYREWIEVGGFDPDRVAQLKDRGIEPRQLARSPEPKEVFDIVRSGEYEGVRGSYCIGDSIAYMFCNEDLTIEQVIGFIEQRQVAKELMATKTTATKTADPVKISSSELEAQTTKGDLQTLEPTSERVSEQIHQNKKVQPTKIIMRISPDRLKHAQRSKAKLPQQQLADLLTVNPTKVASPQQFVEYYPDVYQQLVSRIQARLLDPRGVLLRDIDSEINKMVENLGIEVGFINKDFEEFQNKWQQRLLLRNPTESQKTRDVASGIHRLINAIQTKLNTREVIQMKRYPMVSEVSAKEKAEKEIAKFLDLLFSPNTSRNDYDALTRDLDVRISRYEKTVFSRLAKTFTYSRDIIGGLVKSWYTGDDYDVKCALEPICGFITKPDRPEVLLGKVTINSYGCRVLNANNVLFIDIDFPSPHGRGDSAYGTYSGHSSSAFTSTRTRERALEVLQQLCEELKDLTFLAYETAAGMRIVEITQLHDPRSSSTDYILRCLGADPLYVNMCAQQNCFRARLTPKPWRMFWVSDPEDVAVCAIAGKGFYGNPDAPIHPDVDAVLDVHSLCGICTDGSKVLV